MKAPKVSIIMATFNRAHFIAESLLSIQNQTYTNWECIIVDDGGTDNTREVIAPFLIDKRFLYHKRNNDFKKGLPGSRNYGLSIATGDTVIFFDDDDIVHPENLEICLNTISEKKIDYCSYNKRSFEGDFSFNKLDDNNDYKVELNEEDSLEKMITGNYPMASCTVMWKKECFKNNVFNESLLYAEEWELYQRILSTNVKGAKIDKFLFYNRKHPNSNTGEFWNNNPIRINSKKQAFKLVVDNLKEKKLLSNHLFNYFISQGIYYRDRKLLNYIFEKRENSISDKLYLQFRYLLFPVWKVYKKIIKKIQAH